MGGPCRGGVGGLSTILSLHHGQSFGLRRPSLQTISPHAVKVLKLFCSVRYEDYELYMRLLGEVARVPFSLLKCIG